MPGSLIRDSGFVSAEYAHLLEHPDESRMHADEYNAVFERRSLQKQLASDLDLPFALTFVDQATLMRLKPQRKKVSYDRYVSERGQIPTRSRNLHDYYNFFTWLRFPRSKFALHRLQASLQAERRERGLLNRSSAEDRLTIFDEGSCLRCIAGEQRGMAIFGHAIYESLHLGNDEINAMTLELELDASRALDEEAIDRALSRIIEDRSILTKQATGLPLRVLGLSLNASFEQLDFGQEDRA